MVVAVDVVADLLSGPVEGFPLGSPCASLLELPEPGLDERLGLGIAVAATPMGHPTRREVLAEVPGGELGVVEAQCEAVGDDVVSCPWLCRLP